MPFWGPVWPLNPKISTIAHISSVIEPMDVQDRVVNGRLRVLNVPYALFVSVLCVGMLRHETFR